VRKIPTETKSFQAVLLPLQPDKCPHQMDDRTCWQIGWATNYPNGDTTRGREKRLTQFMSSFARLRLTAVFESSYLLLVVVDSKPQT